MRELGAEQMDGDWLHVIGRTIEVQAAPIGIDVKEVERLTASAEARRQYETIRNHAGDRALIIGVDRLDYSKGIRRAAARLPGTARAISTATAARPFSCRSPPQAARICRSTATCAGRPNG